MARARSASSCQHERRLSGLAPLRQWPLSPSRKLRFQRGKQPGLTGGGVAFYVTLAVAVCTTEDSACRCIPVAA